MGRRTSRRGELGDHIAQARHKAGITQAELAGTVGVSSRQVNRWENGSTIPSRRHAELLAKALILRSAGNGPSSVTSIRSSAAGDGRFVEGGAATASDEPKEGGI